MKRFLSLLLAVILCMGVSLTVFAAEPNPDTITGETSTLPSQTVDMKGNPLELSYVKTSDGIDVYPTSMFRWGWWDGVKCVAGTLGSVGTGFLAGTAAGTITIPGVGAISGMLVGSVSGGLVGIATFC